MTIHVLGTSPLAGEGKRPCPEPACRGGEVQYPEWEGRTETCGACDGEGTITTVLTCQKCDGEGKDVGVFGQSFSPSCPDCVDGHPIIEWEVCDHDLLTAAECPICDGKPMRLAIEAVPIVVGAHPGFSNDPHRPAHVVKFTDSARYWPDDWDHVWDNGTDVTLPEGTKPGDYLIVGTEQLK